MIIIDIALSDIPEANRKVGKNGKIYTQICIDEKKEVDAYGNSHAVYMNQSKEDRAAKVNKVYIGNGKEFKFNGAGNNTPQTKTANLDDVLGF